MFTGGSFKTGVHNRISSTIITDIGINHTTNFNLELHISYFKTQFEDLKKYDIFTLYRFQLSAVRQFLLCHGAKKVSAKLERQRNL